MSAIATKSVEPAADGAGAAAGTAAAEAGAGVFVEGGLRYAVLDGDATEDGLPCVSVGTGAQPASGGTGDASDDASVASVEIPATVSHGGTVYAVTQVAPFAFQGHALQAVTLPEGLLKLAKSSFQFCRGLRGVEVPSTVTLVSALAFFACGSLAELSFAQGSRLKEIGDGAFAVLKTSGSLDNPDPTASLEAVELPAGLRNLGSYAFYGQTALRSVIFLGETLNEVSPYAFGKCTALERIDLPTLTSTIERIGRYAFEDDVSLATVTFQGGVSGVQTTQAGNEFSGCTGITAVVYHQKKWNAQNHGMNPDGSGAAAAAFQGNFSFGSGGFEDSPDAVEYYTVRQYASEEDALAGGEPAGEAVVAAGTPLREVCAAACDFYERGEGFEAGAWAFEGGASVAAGIDDSLYAYPCDGSDLAFGALEVDTGSLDEDGYPALTAAQAQAGSYEARVWDAAGNELEAGRDYELSFEDIEDAGDAEDGGEASGQEGVLRSLVAAGTGGYHGETAATVDLVEAADDWARLGDASWARTAQLAVQATFANASAAEVPCDWAVVVAGGPGHAADACVAAALAGALGAPVLPTDGASLSDEAAYEINRVGASAVVVVGDAEAVSEDVAAQLEGLYVVDRLYRVAGTGEAGQGLDMRAATLAPSLGVAWPGACVVAAEGDVAAALAASSYLYAEAAPLVWAGAGAGDADAGVSADEAAALAGAGIASAAVLGGEGRVPQAAVDALEAAGISCARVGADAADDAALAAAVAGWAMDEGFSAAGAAVFSAGAPEYAVGAAALAGRARAVCLSSAAAVPFLAGRGAEGAGGYLLGPAQVVSDELLARLEALS